MMKSPRIVFMGSPAFALPSLRGLAESFSVVGVVTQPDRPAGRGKQVALPPVKVLAESLGLPVIQPGRLREPEAMSCLVDWQPDLIVVAAFGQILRPDILNLPAFGCVNVHASLLPAWRGAAPIPAAILNGDQASGVTIMLMDAGVDTGPQLASRSETILPGDTTESLGGRLAELGAALLLETLPRYLSGALQPTPQNHALASFAPMLKKEDGVLDFAQPAEILARKIRAYHPWPGAAMLWQGQPFKVLAGHVAASLAQTGGRNPFPGERLSLDGFPAVATTSGVLMLDTVQPPGKKPMPGNEFLRGARNWERRDA